MVSGTAASLDISLAKLSNKFQTTMMRSKSPSSETAESKGHGEEGKSEAHKFCSMPSYLCECTHICMQAHIHTYINREKLRQTETETAQWWSKYLHFAALHKQSSWLRSHFRKECMDHKKTHETTTPWIPVFTSSLDSRAIRGGHRHYSCFLRLQEMSMKGHCLG